MTDEELWADFEASPLNLYVCLAETGLWCPVCNLSTGARWYITTDPSEPAEPGIGQGVCLEDRSHVVPMEAA